MNRLWVRLALAFSVVTAVAVLAVAALADFAVRGNVQQFIQTENAYASLPVADSLGAFYAQRGSWDGVGQVLGQRLGGGPQQGQGPHEGMMNGMAHMMGNRPARLVADENYRVVFADGGGRTGTPFNPEEKANAIPILINNKTVGYFVTATAEPGAVYPEQAFLSELRGTLGLAAAIAGALGIALSLIISRTLAAPLASLANAARQFARGASQTRVEERGADEMKAVARAFNEMATEIERAESLRRNMVADIAHELRTPLTVMQGNLGAMLDEVYPLDRAEIATLYDQTRLLSRLVNDLRELALADAGQMQLHITSIKLADLLNSVVANFSVGAEAQNVVLALDADLPSASVNADADRVRQVLQNLVANALRHTPDGGHVTVHARQDSVSSVRVEVSDTGEGIAAEDLPHVFERFYRGDRSRTRTTGSTGLGLAIAKAWVDAMGGKIGVESERGNGARFWFTLPVAIQT